MDSEDRSPSRGGSWLKQSIRGFALLAGLLAGYLAGGDADSVGGLVILIVVAVPVAAALSIFLDWVRRETAW
jgi:hypothetical protein